MSKNGLREVPWGISDDCEEVCIYDNGHIEADAFIQSVVAFASSDVPKDTRETLTAEDVQYLRFRPMSPSEARAWGCTSGVMKAEGGRGYPVTAVIL